MSIADLLARARELSEGTDLGPEREWRPGLGAALGAFDQNDGASSEERRAGLLGLLVDYLRRRLDVEMWYARVPEISGEDVEDPVFVLGMPRTGTTAMLMLLSHDPALRCLTYWEGRSPTPPAGVSPESVTARIREAEEHLRHAHRVLPGMQEFHPYAGRAEGPVETYDFLGMCFTSTHLSAFLDAPVYEKWLLGADLEPSYAFLRRCLQLLRHGQPARPWVLKNPQDLLALDAIQRHFPRARFIWMHRPLEEALLSACEMVLSTSASPPDEIGRMVIDRWDAAASRAVAARALIEPERLVDVWQPDLKRDACAVIQSAYEHLSLPFSAELADAVAGWANANRPRRVAEASTSTFGLHRADERFGSYRTLLRQIAS